MPWRKADRPDFGQPCARDACVPHFFVTFLSEKITPAPKLLNPILTMSDNGQSNNKWSSKVNEMNLLSQRAAKLSERGAHYFVGWLIGAGMQNPAMAAEFEKVLHRLETDPLLRYCWREFDDEDAAAAPVEQIDLSFSKELTAAATEQAAVPTEAPPAPVFQELADVHARSGVVEFKDEPAPASSGPTGFFGKIFRRQRLAA